MFTDIEGSTRLHQRLHERFAAVLAEHDSLLTAEVAAADGVVVKRMGDGLFSAFSSAASAAVAASGIQRAVARHEWPPGEQLRVRVGLHSGEAEPVDGDYVSLSVNQAARVASAAHGGQVLATTQVIDGVGDHVGRWEDIGSYRLKDFDEPVHLFQLVVDGVEAPRVEGARATPASAHNVPEVRSSFVGRARELSELAAMFSSGARLVSLLGPGGVGKTRLAFELVKQIAPSYSAGGWVVLLANATLVEEIDDRVLRTLRVPDRREMTPRQSLLAALAQRETLLLLDNTEHVSDQVADLVQKVLDECPDVRMLTTSRQPLGIAGEVEWRLPPLPVHGDVAGSDSVELFIQRASARNPKVFFGADDRHVIEDICQQVDGLPLGIELAAGWLRHMKLNDLAARLHERLHHAPGPDPTADERQRTLHSLVDWSYRLLGGPAQSLLRRMSLLQGPAPLEAVEALADPSKRVDDALAELVDKSLVNFDDDSDSHIGC
jgi:predicted ATPase